MNFENWLKGECALKIDFKFEKKFLELLGKSRLLISSINIEEGKYMYIKKGVWCNNVIIVDETELPKSIVKININELENYIDTSIQIDWKKEKATKNYCGYCNSTPTGGSCNGECFKEEKNRIDHVLTMLKIIPEQIEELKNKEEKYKNSLKC